MVAFKEEFPYLRCESGQLVEFDRAWLRAAITRAADQAGYPSWWLTDHVTESIAFYLRLRNDEPAVAFSQLSQTVRYVLRGHRLQGNRSLLFTDTTADYDFSFRDRAASRHGLRTGVLRSSGETTQRARRHRDR